MKLTKKIVLVLIVLLSASVFLPAVNAHAMPMVQFAGNALGAALVLYIPPGANPSSITDFVSIGFGMFSIMGQTYLPEGTSVPSVMTDGLVLRENRFLVNFGGQTINVRFQATPATMAIFEDISPDNDFFVVGDGSPDFTFYGTFRNVTGTYNVQGNAQIICMRATFNQNQPTPVWVFAALLEGSDGSLFEVIWAAESGDLQTGPTTFITLPAAAVFGHSVDFTLS